MEDKAVKGQRAHITADVVLERGVERLMLGQNWCDAWRRVAGLCLYLRGIAEVWRDDKVLGVKNRNMTNGIIEWCTHRAALAQLNFKRDDIDLDEAWYTEPPGGKYEDRKALRTYYDHEPVGDEITDGYRVAQWRPNLSSK